MQAPPAAPAAGERLRSADCPARPAARRIRARSSCSSRPVSRRRGTSRSSSRRPICITSSRSSAPRRRNQWVTYDDASEKTIQDDFHRLWNTNFLDNLWIDVSDYKFPNGTIGKIVTYNMEERQRVKIVDYVGSKKIEVSKIDEKLKDANAQIRLDSFIDPGLVRKVEGIVRDMLRGEGLPVRRRHPRHQGDPRRPEAGSHHLQHGRGAEGQDPQDRVHRQQGDQRRRRSSSSSRKTRSRGRSPTSSISRPGSSA